jgi:NAD(P)H-hydrate repair Nnr-like enzyme with NAD(P)H-hydrate dehydratase domain
LLEFLVQKKHVVYCKGVTDQLISYGHSESISETGSARRTGGIGDVLSGVITGFAAKLSTYGKLSLEEILIAVKEAGLLVREASRFTFDKFGRGFAATKVIDALPDTFEQHFR